MSIITKSGARLKITKSWKSLTCSHSPWALWRTPRHSACTCMSQAEFTSSLTARCSADCRSGLGAEAAGATWKVCLQMDGSSQLGSFCLQTTHGASWLSAQVQATIGRCSSGPEARSLTIFFGVARQGRPTHPGFASHGGPRLPSGPFLGLADWPFRHPIGATLPPPNPRTSGWISRSAGWTSDPGATLHVCIIRLINLRKPK